MAFPLIPIAIAALAAGTAASVKSQRQVRKAQERAYHGYADRSDKRTQEAVGYFDESLRQQDVNVQQQAVDDAAKAKVSRVAEISAGQNYVDPILPGQSRAPQVIKSQVAASLADELARARAQIGAVAKLEGFSTRTFDRGLELDHLKPNFSNLAIFAQGDRNIFDAESADAAHKGDNMALLGDLLTSLGGLGLTAGMGAGGSSAGKGATTVGSADAASKAGSVGRSGLFNRGAGYPF